MSQRSVRVARWLSVLTAILAAVGTLRALRLSVGTVGTVPLIWMALPSIAGIACYAGARRDSPALVSAGVGLIWSVAILGMWSIGGFFAPASLAGTIAAITFAAGSPKSGVMSIVWFAIGLTALCAFDVLYASSQSYEIRWVGGFSVGRVVVSPIIIYGAWLFVVLVSIVTVVAISRKLIAVR